MQAQIAIVYHSGYGHTRVLAQAVALGVDRVRGARADLVDVTTMSDADWGALGKADAHIFGSPTYMGAVSAPFKHFMDLSSATWLARGWSNKLAAGFTVSSSQAGDKFATLNQLSTFAAQHGMIWVSLDQLPGNNSATGSVDDYNRIGASIGVMAQANNDEGPEVAPPSADRETAARLGARVANLTLQFLRGAQGADLEEASA